MIVVKAPNEIPDNNFPSVFLAGSIEMGKAVDWQTAVTNSLADIDAIVLNPRRDDWDSSWEQKIENDKFREQVEWELDALDHARVILMYFDPKTMSPISLLELGLHARTSTMIVCCPTGFWRKGNVDIVCKRHGIKQVETLEELIASARKELQ